MFRIARFTSSNLTWLQGKFWTIPRIQTWSEYSAVPILLVVHRWHDPDPHKHGKIPRLTPWYDLINVTQQHGGFILRLIKATLPEVTHNCLKAHRDGYYQHTFVPQSRCSPKVFLVPMFPKDVPQPLCSPIPLFPSPDVPLKCFQSLCSPKIFLSPHAPQSL